MTKPSLSNGGLKFNSNLDNPRWPTFVFNSCIKIRS
uniref:Uncharacterized protein n=1 Tax=Arundo donax TaxID=35708 RepID=A0A0A9HLM4_ARUDO